MKKHSLKIGQVIKIDANIYKVFDGKNIYHCTLRGKLKKTKRNVTKLVVVGDFVDFYPAEGLTGAIEKIRERKTKISRPHPYTKSKEQIIATNIDSISVVYSAVSPQLNIHIIDRCLVTAESSYISASVCITKKDMLNNDKAEEIRKQINLYNTIGYKTFFISAHNEQDIEPFIEYNKDKTIVLLGPSGVGKTTIINTIQPELNLKTEKISQKLHKGRHTTTWVEMLFLNRGLKIIDTPGLEVFGLWNVTPHNLCEFFPEMQPLLGKCKFVNCIHNTEPNCAVKNAVNKNIISSQRYTSYLKILQGLTENNK